MNALAGSRFCFPCVKPPALNHHLHVRKLRLMVTRASIAVEHKNPDSKLALVRIGTRGRYPSFYFTSIFHFHFWVLFILLNFVHSRFNLIFSSEFFVFFFFFNYNVCICWLAMVFSLYIGLTFIFVEVLYVSRNDAYWLMDQESRLINEIGCLF